jgi:tetratricopeptide (TPR) repeat protein
VYEKLEDRDKAAESLRKALDMGLKSLSAHFRLIVLLMEDHPEEALAIARRAKKLAPRQHLVADTLAWCLIENNKLEEALPELQLALRAVPEAPRYRYHHALLLSRQNRTAEAVDELRRALSSSRDFTERQEAELLLAELTKEK